MKVVRTVLAWIADHLGLDYTPPVRVTDSESEETRTVVEKADRAVQRADDLWQEHVRESWGLPPRA